MSEVEFLKESNAIEGVYDADSLVQAIYAWEYLKEQKEMTVGVILKTHKILMLHQRLAPHEKGYLRNEPVYIGGHEAMDWRKIPARIGTWCDNTMNARWSAKKLHISFEEIHPFILSCGLNVSGNQVSHHKQLFRSQHLFDNVVLRIASALQLCLRTLLNHLNHHHQRRHIFRKQK